ncbi:hypothetical protein MMC14_009324 [Varicellaria rhodocarpa]|nr:hypothetical protein [Varicellaria rhodocarpa]
MAYFDGHYAGAARAIHDTLIQACDPHPWLNYKNGTFATAITSSRSVIGCLDLLISSPLTDPKETSVFRDVRRFLTRYKAREANGTANPPDFMDQMDSLMRFPEVFNDDQRLRVIRRPETVCMIAPEDFKDEDLSNHVKLLLRVTVDAIILACSNESGFKGGIFRSTMQRSTPIIVMLGVLSRDDRLTATEKTIFSKALVEVRKLLELQLQGVTIIEPKTMMYLGHLKWFKPMLRVFDEDFESRLMKKPEFKWYTLFPEVTDEDLQHLDIEQDKGAGVAWPSIRVPSLMVSSGKVTDSDSGFEKNVRGAFM